MMSWQSPAMRMRVVHGPSWDYALPVPSMVLSHLHRHVTGPRRARGGAAAVLQNRRAANGCLVSELCRLEHSRYEPKLEGASGLPISTGKGPSGIYGVFIALYVLRNALAIGRGIVQALRCVGVETTQFWASPAHHGGGQGGRMNMSTRWLSSVPGIFERKIWTGNWSGVSPAGWMGGKKSGQDAFALGLWASWANLLNRSCSL